MILRLLATSLCAALACLHAQDTRSVSEPVFPPPCTQLAAQLTAGPTGLPLASETKFDTARIQTALTECPAGQEVELMPAGANNAFLIQPITIPKGVTLTVDAGVTVFASRNPRDYDDPNALPQACGTIGATATGCVPLITAHRADGGGLMGYGVIDGRGELPLLINGQPAVTSWWDLTLQAHAQGLNQSVPRILDVDTTNGFTIYKITLLNSPYFHIALVGDAGVTVWGVKIITPYDVPNTDGIDVIYSHDVTIRDSYLSDGDDNIAFNGGTPPGAYNVSILNTKISDGIGAVAFGSYTTYGITNVLVDGLTIAGSTANRNQRGLYGKSDVSRGGLVHNVTYQNVCMQNARYVMQFDPFYTPGATGTSIPQFYDFTIQNVHSTTEGLVQIYGHDPGLPTRLALDNVLVDGIQSSDVTAEHAFIIIGLDPVNFASMLKGTDVSGASASCISQEPVPTVPPSCITPAAPYACPDFFFSPVGVEMIPGPPQIAAGQSMNVQIQVFPTKAVPYQTYLANLKSNPNATMALPAPTGTVTITDGSPDGTGPAGAKLLASAPISGTGWTTITVPGLNAGLHTLGASYSGDANYAVAGAFTYTMSVLPAGTPVVSPGGIVNAASGATGAAPYGIAQGGMFSIYGTDFGPAHFAQVAASYPLSTNLGGTSVRILEAGNSYVAYPVFVSSGQINAILPSGVPAGDAQIIVTNNGIAGPPANFRVVPTRLGIFNVNGAAVAQNVATPTNYPLNSPATPAKPGQFVLLWASGMGPVAGADDIAPGSNAGDMTNVLLTITVGGVPAERLYAGRQAQTAGVDNIYFIVPGNAPLGCQVPVTVSAGGFAANTTTIAISADGSPCQ